ncbi:lactonase family protein [Fructilactobacillus sp. Tb1]|uniref:lactonase family protein n=1 Tax=Fructilactobacillus sp. Tb1 TaxID=3422304 RepID=UPI003D269A34
MIEKFLVGTYTKHQSEGVYQIELDTDKKQLQNAVLVAKAGSPTYVAESKAHKVYAIDKKTDGDKTIGGLLVFDGNNIPFKEIQDVTEEGSSPAYVTVDELHQNVYTANYHTGNVHVFNINADGTLTETDRIHDVGEVGPLPEQASGAHPHYADLTYDNRIAVCDLGLDKVYLYDLSDQGKLNIVSETTMAPGFGPRHIKFVEKTGKAYLVGELSSKLAVLDYNEETGELAVQQVVSTIPADWTEHNGAAAIRISADGRFVYVSNRGNNSLAVFEILADGNVQMIQLISIEGEFPRDFTFNSDEKFIVAVNQNTNNATLYERDADTGKLTMIQKDFAVPEGTCVTLRK